jgi:hypothetical protein
MLLYRVQMDADETGIVQPQAVQAFDTSIDLDKVTGKPVRGTLRPIKLLPTTQQKIADIVNQELGGVPKGEERLQALRDELAAAEEAAAAEALKQAEAAAAVVVTDPANPSDPPSP